MKKLILLLNVVLLTACGSNPMSYLPSGTTPIVNIEADIHDKVQLETQIEQFAITNLTHHNLNVVYKLFWYDIDGVTQPSDEQWQNLWLSANQQRQVVLQKPTKESANYRIYLKQYR